MQAQSQSRAAEQPAPKNLSLGYAAILFAVVIWAGWIVATRHAMLGSYEPMDLALIRYGLPAVLLAPVWLKRGIFPKGENPWLMAIMTIGWGGPFVVLISTGLQTVPASVFGPLVPGLLPLVVAFWGLAVFGERIKGMRWAGLALIALAVVLILGPAIADGDQGMLTGAPYLLLACAGWSAFTIAFRSATLSGLESAAYVCLYSTPMLLAAVAYSGTEILSWSLADVALQSLMQGLLSGMAAVAAYGYSIKALGLARASAFTCLVPVLAALGGWAMLDEVVTPAGWGAAAAACLGVLLVNRAVT
jgi:drug/metabolite transporter (DMT)-like permease